MKPNSFLVLAVLLLTAGSVTAATFVVPTDDELLLKSVAVVIGTVEGSYVQEANGTIETVQEIRLERGLKGAVKNGELLRVVTLGGVLGERGVLVPGEAQFRQGERVLVFLDRDERGRWRTTDLTLGRFKFVTSTRGERMLVRQMEDVVGWDYTGRAHKEQIRREAGFLQFIEARTNKRVVPTDYFVDASAVTLAPEPAPRFEAAVNATSYPASTFTRLVNNQPIRWPNMGAGVSFHKRSDQNISGAADGGVSVIQGGLAAWTNEPSSNINVSYIGQIAKASTNHDATNVVEFNDPQSRISGSWTGSGTLGICFLSFSGSHSFLGQSWLNITDADVVFQDGYPATNASFSSAMTHELGHGLGWRHSNQNHVTGGACDANVEECASAAIMNSSVSANYGYTLQPWDRNAAQSVYPGAATCTAPAITAEPTSRSITSGQSTTLSVTATGTSAAYQWYVGASGSTAAPISGATGPSVTVAPTGTTSYWVRVSNACGAVNSVAATVTVTAPPPSCTAPAITTQPTARTITSGQSTTLSVSVTGTGPLNYRWYAGTSGTALVQFGSVTTSNTVTVSPTQTTMYKARIENTCGAVESNTITVTVTQPAPPANATRTPNDFNGDGRSDILWRSTAGQNAIWLMNAFTLQQGSLIPSEVNTQRRIAGTGDFDGDGKADILWRDPATGENSVWLMNIFAVKQSAAAPVVPASYNVVGTGDFNGDGRGDLLWRNQTTGGNFLWLMNGVTPTQVAIRFENTSWRVAGVGDFNGDGRADILWRNFSTTENAIWLMNGATLQQGSYIRFENLSWTVAGVGDFNGDGKADILWRNGTQNAIWLMDAFTLTSGAVILGQPTAFVVASIGDYNGDGRSDIFWRNTGTGENYFWLMNGFTATTGAIRAENLSWSPAR